MSNKNLQQQYSTYLIGYTREDIEGGKERRKILMK